MVSKTGDERQREYYANNQGPTGTRYPPATWDFSIPEPAQFSLETCQVFRVYPKYRTWLVSFPNPLALESGLVERTPKNGLIWLWSLILRKNCIKPLVLGTSLASHTHKLSVSTAETSFCLILEPQSPFFFQPPVWDKFNLQFGTQFISISMDFHSYLIISMGQNAVPIGPFLGVRSPASLSEWGGEPV